MNRDLTLAMRMYMDTARFVGGLQNSERGLDKFVERSKRQIADLRGAWSSLEGKLATVGVTVGALKTAGDAGRLTKDLTRIGQTADMSRDEVAKLRAEFFRMAQETGREVDSLKEGYDLAVQSGLKFREAVPVTEAVNKAMAVTNARAESLTSALTVAATAFEFDLAKPEEAVTLLDKMTVAGRQGNAELENLSSIFARVAVNSRQAGFSFEGTLAFIEGLSQMERQPERLATLADSTLRLFTNQKYLQDAADATGVSFFDAKGSRRDPMKVLDELRAKYRALKTDADRSNFLQSAFGKADLDTQRGMKMLFTGAMQEDIRRMNTEIAKGAGQLDHDLKAAIDNSIDQTGRLKAALREAADSFVQPINDTFSNVVKWGMDKKENGGLGLDGKDMILGAGGLAALIYGGAKIGGKIFGKKGAPGAAPEFMTELAGLGKGVATGKALATMGIQPVYVVNMPAGGMSTSAGAPELPGMPSGPAGAAGKGKWAWLKNANALRGLSMGEIGGLGGRAVLTAGGQLAYAGLAGYGAGKYAFNPLLDWGISKAAGHDASLGTAMFDLFNKPQQLDITLRIGADGKPVVESVKQPPRSRLQLNPMVGPYMAAG